MSQPTKKVFISGIAWSFVQNILVKGVTFLISIILARILMPEDFGLIGILSIFIAISQVVIESGFGEALIQKVDCNDVDYSTAFFFNIFISISVYLLLFFCAPLIASFYHEPKLCSLTRVLALNIVFGSFNIVQRSKLKRSFNFKALAIVTFGGVVVGGSSGLILAKLGYGVWALVAQTISTTIACMFLYPFFTKWHPLFVISKESFDYLWNYGSKMLVTGVFSSIQTNIANILIGRYYKANQVGYYAKAQKLGEMPSQVLFSVFNNVTFPTFCGLQNDRQKLVLAYKRILFNTVLVVCPIIILLSLLSEPIVMLLLTEKWAPSIPLLQILLLARMFLPIGATHTNLIRSVGNTKLYMKIYFITGPFALLAIIVAMPWGIKAMVFASLIAALFSYTVPAIVSGRMFGYSFFRQIYDWRKIIISLLLMSIGVYIWTIIFSGYFVQLIGGLVLGLLIYFFSCHCFRLIDKELFMMLKNRL